MKEKMKKRMIEDKRGQMSIDFLVGISLFILALSFVAVSVSGMFLPFQTETIDLNSVSYRTSVILVEDAGYWSDGANDGEDWENHVNNISRIGLAIDKMHPNELELNKLAIFGDEAEIDDEELSDKLGLYRIIGDSKVYYGYNIALTSLDGEVLITRGDEIPEYGDVSSMKRIVNAQTDSVYVIEKLKGNPKENDKALFNTTNPEEDIVMVIGNIVVQGSNPELMFVYVDDEGNKLNYGDDYWIWIKNETSYFESQATNSPNMQHPDILLPDVPYNTTAEVKIKISKSVLHTGENLIEIKFKHIVIEESGRINLDNLEKTIISESTILKVNIWN